MSDAQIKLLTFAAAVIDQCRGDGFPGDVDGGWLHDKMVDLGVLVGVPVSEPCDPEHCPCAECDGIPGECYRLEAMVHHELMKVAPDDYAHAVLPVGDHQK